MKPRWIALPALVAALVLTGCASDTEPTQKQREKMARDIERENQKQAQAQAKMMRESQQGTQQRRAR
jgi:PBP1b-binding outer membrane lipoprotein LpoB